jgi:hypothetical protein
MALGHTQPLMLATIRSISFPPAQPATYVLFVFSAGPAAVATAVIIVGPFSFSSSSSSFDSGFPPANVTHVVIVHRYWASPLIVRQALTDESLWWFVSAKTHTTELKSLCDASGRPLVS